MQPESKQFVQGAISRAKQGTGSQIFCFSDLVEKDVRYQAKRALRRIPGRHKLIQTMVVGNKLPYALR